MQREIEFRVWNKVDKEFVPFLWTDIVSWQYQAPFTEEYTAQQFAGLLDRKGKKIFEGDIVAGTLEVYDGRYKESKRPKEYSGIIHWNHSYWAIGDYKLFVLLDSSLEVIGNIFENPELLKP